MKGTLLAVSANDLLEPARRKDMFYFRCNSVQGLECISLATRCVIDPSIFVQSKDNEKPWKWLLPAQLPAGENGQSAESEHPGANAGKRAIEKQHQGGTGY